MNSKQPKKTKKPPKDSQIKQLIQERSAMNESLNSLLGKINKNQK